MHAPTRKKGDGPEQTSSRTWLFQGDAELLAQCAVDAYRASGPGGQKRNKTSSAVRLRHGPSGLIVVAQESRSQHENRTRALYRLRRSIALTQRNTIDPAGSAPEFYRAALTRDPTLRVSSKHPDYWRIVQYVFDVLAVCQASVSQAAEDLQISTGNLIRFLKKDDPLWAQANQLRQEFGHGPLR